MPVNNPAINVARVDYEFFPFAQYPATGFSESNPASVLIIERKFINDKSVDKNYAVQGDKLHYTTTVTNPNDPTKTDLVFKDPIPAGTTFVAGSVKVNGVAQPTYDPQAGFDLPDLAAGASAVVEFDVEVN